jgi:hypothetical protein
VSDHELFFVSGWTSPAASYFLSIRAAYADLEDPQLHVVAAFESRPWAFDDSHSLRFRADR